MTPLRHNFDARRLTKSWLAASDGLWWQRICIFFVVHSFLSSYSNKPVVGHMKVKSYALHYIHSMHDYSISFTSDMVALINSVVHHLPSTDIEAYSDALPLSPTTSSTLSAYSDPCWGSQIDNAVADGTLLPHFKFCSMIGGIVFHNGSPISWLGEWQERTPLSSCEAEIRTTSTTSKKVVDFCNLCRSASDSGHSLFNPDLPTILYNNNDACVKWSYNMTSKAARHIQLQENLSANGLRIRLFRLFTLWGKSIRPTFSQKNCAMGLISVVFATLSWQSLSDFLHKSVLAIHQSDQSSPNNVDPAAARVSTSPGKWSFMTVLALSSFFWNLSIILHLSSAGWQILWGLHGFVPLSLIWISWAYWSVPKIKFVFVIHIILAKPVTNTLKSR